MARCALPCAVSVAAVVPVIVVAQVSLALPQSLLKDHYAPGIAADELVDVTT